MAEDPQYEAEKDTVSHSNMPDASAEIAKAINEAAKDVSKNISVQMSAERLLKATLESLPPPHRIEDCKQLTITRENYIPLR